MNVVIRHTDGLEGVRRRRKKSDHVIRHTDGLEVWRVAGF